MRIFSDPLLSLSAYSWPVEPATQRIGETQITVALHECLIEDRCPNQGFLQVEVVNVWSEVIARPRIKSAMEPAAQGLVGRGAQS